MGRTRACADSLESYGGVTRETFNAVCSPYDLTSTYYPAFKHAVTQGKAKGVMCSYNEVNGIPSCANDFMNYTLRGKWCVPCAVGTRVGGGRQGVRV